MRLRKFIRETLTHLFFVAVFGYGLYWIWQRTKEAERMTQSHWFSLIFIFSVVVYVIFVLISFRHLFGNYLLERYDPGNTQSVRRLQRVRRFRLPQRLSARLQQWKNPVPMISHWLQSNSYEEYSRWTYGFVFEKERRLPGLFPFRRQYDRLYVVYRPMVNVLIVDNIIKESIRLLQREKQHDVAHHVLLIITNMEQPDETASAAAGVVNFLGKTDEGSLGVLFLDLQHNRLYHPLDRSLIPWKQRGFQNRIRRNLRRNLARIDAADVLEQKAEPQLAPAAIRSIRLQDPLQRQTVNEEQELLQE